jgi:hypothetical protein
VETHCCRGALVPQTLEPCRPVFKDSSTPNPTPGELPCPAYVYSY